MSSEEKTEKKSITRNKRICTLLVNESNYKKVLFFPFHESQTFTSTDRKIVDSCNKWNPIKKTNSSSIDAVIVCHNEDGLKVPINPPFTRKLKDVFYPRRPNRSFLPHQKVLQKRFRENLPKSYLLYWEMGSGKTLGILSALFLLDKIPPKISIVCSISMIDYWLNNILDFDTKNNTFEVEIMGYSYFENKFLEEDNVTDDYIKSKMSKRVFIVDEAHHYRNMTTNMERALLKLSFAKNLYLLTGTPLVNSADEMKIWAKFLNIDTPPPSNNSKDILSWVKKYGKNKIMYFHPVMNKNMKENNCYPDVEHETVTIPMTWKQTLIYFLSQGNVDFCGTQIISSKKNNGLSLHKQVANGFKDNTGKFISPKNEFIIKTNSDTAKYPLPHVIFSSNLETGVEDIFRKLNQKDVSVNIITGNTNADERQEIVDKYNQGKIDNLLLSRVGNEGINLLGTGTLFITTRHENEESANQTKARVVRYESHVDCDNKKVKIVDLISVFPKSEPTSEEKKDLAEHMSQCLHENISGNEVVQQLRQKMKACNNITVEEHLNLLNKAKDAELKPVMDGMKEVGKDWWQPPLALEVTKKKEFKKERKSPVTSRKRTVVSKTVGKSVGKALSKTVTSPKRLKR
jgi:superfamily II DNA or RNA helicase